VLRGIGTPRWPPGNGLYSILTGHRVGTVNFGDTAADDGDIFGEGVNIDARINAIAPRVNRKILLQVPLTAQR
jgi:class 3 adenylate cyclase